jgi:NAD(P)H-dependent FMN reductase
MRRRRFDVDRSVTATRPRLLAVCGSLQASSSNASALDVVRRDARRLGAELDDFTRLGDLPPFNVDVEDVPDLALDEWRRLVGAADVVLVAAPEYAGGVAGVVKNAFDWLVGSGGMYRKPVAVLSAGTSGGQHARQQLVQTLTWQGAWVVAELGIAAPRTKIDAAGRVVDPATLTALGDLTAAAVAAASAPPDTLVATSQRVAASFGIASDRVAAA